METTNLTPNPVEETPAVLTPPSVTPTPAVSPTPVAPTPTVAISQPAIDNAQPQKNGLTKQPLTVLIISWILAVIFIVIGTIILTSDEKETVQIYRHSPVNYQVESGNYYYFSFTPNQTDYYYFSVDGGYLSSISYNNDNYSKSFNTEETISGYDHTYETYLASNYTYDFCVYATYSTIKIIIQ